MPQRPHKTAGVDLAGILTEVCEAVQVKLDGTRRERVIDTVNLYAQGVSVRRGSRDGRGGRVLACRLVYTFRNAGHAGSGGGDERQGFG